MTHTVDTATASTPDLQERTLHAHTADDSRTPARTIAFLGLWLLPDRLMEDTPICGAENLRVKVQPAPRRSTARALLRHAGTWVGDDLEQCLDAVYRWRSEVRF